jgi:hypothetical protein
VVHEDSIGAVVVWRSVRALSETVAPALFDGDGFRTTNNLGGDELEF